MNDTTILNAIHEYFDERDDSLRLVTARAYGSRMMNLDGPNSDYDVFVLFAQQPHEYAKVHGYTDTFDVSLTDDIEATGWNVKKFAELLKKSNPTALEVLNSDTEYFRANRVNGTLDSLRVTCNESMSPIALYHHYVSLAESNYWKYIVKTVHDGDGKSYRLLEERENTFYVDTHDSFTETVATTVSKQHFERATVERSVKRWLYVVRAILYARYVERTGEMPTMDFPSFTRTVNDDGELLSFARELVSRKRSGDKYDEITASKPVRGLVEAEIDSEYSASYDRSMPVDELNQFVEVCVER